MMQGNNERGRRRSLRRPTMVRLRTTAIVEHRQTGRSRIPLHAMITQCARRGDASVNFVRRMAPGRRASEQLTANELSESRLARSPRTVDDVQAGRQVVEDDFG